MDLNFCFVYPCTLKPVYGLSITAVFLGFFCCFIFHYRIASLIHIDFGIPVNTVNFNPVSQSSGRLSMPCYLHLMTCALPSTDQCWIVRAMQPELFVQPCLILLSTLATSRSIICRQNSVCHMVVQDLDQTSLVCP